MMTDDKNEYGKTHSGQCDWSHEINVLKRQEADLRSLIDLLEASNNRPWLIQKMTKFLEDYSEE